MSIAYKPAVTAPANALAKSSAELLAEQYPSPPTNPLAGTASAGTG